MSGVGTHALLDLWHGAHLCDPEAMERVMRRAAAAAHAQVLFAHFHPFDGGGFTGVVLLAESHITVHTWPETGLSAFDLFLCGAANMDDAIAVLLTALNPDHHSLRTVVRGEQVS